MLSSIPETATRGTEPFSRTDVETSSRSIQRTSPRHTPETSSRSTVPSPQNNVTPPPQNNVPPGPAPPQQLHASRRSGDISSPCSGDSYPQRSGDHFARHRTTFTFQERHTPPAHSNVVSSSYSSNTIFEARRIRPSHHVSEASSRGVVPSPHVRTSPRSRTSPHSTTVPSPYSNIIPSPNSNVIPSPHSSRSSRSSSSRHVSPAPARFETDFSHDVAQSPPGAAPGSPV